MIGIFGPSFWVAIIFFAMIGFVALLILYALKYRRTHKPPQYEDFNTMQVRNRVKPPEKKLNFYGIPSASDSEAVKATKAGYNSQLTVAL